MRRLAAAVMLVLPGALPALAVLPQLAAMPPVTPAPRDIVYPGTLTLDVDATGAAQGIFRVRETIPVAGGPTILFFPQWKPGNHSPTGPLQNLAGLTFTAGGKPVAWTRDPVNMFAFHLTLPAGAREVTARFQYLAPQRAGGMYRVVTTPDLLDLQWDSMALYPAGYHVRGIKVKPSATWPAGWTAFTALRGSKAGDRTSYDPVALDVLLDSPVHAGRYARQIALDPQVSLDLIGDRPGAIAIDDAEIARAKAVVAQADKVFGTRHFDHYDMLIAASDTESGQGLEHHRSFEISMPANFLVAPETRINRSVVPHEYVHSWNGKFRRPADLWTADYNTPMRTSLLWVYEGQTEFWGNVLAARSGTMSRQDYLDTLAMVAADYTEGNLGARWRPLQDTTNDPIVNNHGPGSDWSSWSRRLDYYANGELIWIEADQLIRQRTGGAKGLDDFARSFFGVEPGQWDHESTYGFDDVVAALNAVTPYDWAGFLRQRLDGLDPRTTLAGLEAGGYRLVFADTPTPGLKPLLQGSASDDLFYSIGFGIRATGAIGPVRWDGPAFKAGLHPGMSVVAVGDLPYSGARLRDAIVAAVRDKAPITLLVKDADRIAPIAIDYHGGLRYPRLEKIGSGEAGLDQLLAPR